MIFEDSIGGSARQAGLSNTDMRVAVMRGCAGI